MKLKTLVLGLPLLVGLTLATVACDSPDTETEIETPTGETEIEQPATSPEATESPAASPGSPAASPTTP